MKIKELKKYIQNFDDELDIEILCTIYSGFGSQSTSVRCRFDMDEYDDGLWIYNQETDEEVMLREDGERYVRMEIEGEEICSS